MQLPARQHHTLVGIYRRRHRLLHHLHRLHHLRHLRHLRHVGRRVGHHRHHHGLPTMSSSRADLTWKIMCRTRALASRAASSVEKGFTRNTTSSRVHPTVCTLGTSPHMPPQYAITACQHGMPPQSAITAWRHVMAPRHGTTSCYTNVFYRTLY